MLLLQLLIGFCDGKYLLSTKQWQCQVQNALNKKNVISRINMSARKDVPGENRNKWLHLTADSDINLNKEHIRYKKQCILLSND